MDNLDGVDKKKRQKKKEKIQRTDSLKFKKQRYNNFLMIRRKKK